MEERSQASKQARRETATASGFQCQREARKGSGAYTWATGQDADGQSGGAPDKRSGLARLAAHLESGTTTHLETCWSCNAAQAGLRGLVAPYLPKTIRHLGLPSHAAADRLGVALPRASDSSPRHAPPQLVHCGWFADADESAVSPPGGRDMALPQLGKTPFPPPSCPPG